MQISDSCFQLWTPLTGGLQTNITVRRIVRGWPFMLRYFVNFSKFLYFSFLLFIRVPPPNLQLKPSYNKRVRGIFCLYQILEVESILERRFYIINTFFLRKNLFNFYVLF